VTETRFARTVRTNRQPQGRTTVDIECPFCGCVVQARAWSLAGTGKRCECGALLHGDGIGSAAATQPTRRKQER